MVRDRRGRGEGRSPGMGYLFIVVGIVVVAALAWGLVALLGSGGGRSGPVHSGRQTGEAADLPHAEKEQMEGPQEEFVNDAEPPSAGPPPEPRDGGRV